MIDDQAVRLAEQLEAEMAEQLRPRGERRQQHDVGGGVQIEFAAEELEGVSGGR